MLTFKLTLYLGNAKTEQEIQCETMSAAVTYAAVQAARLDPKSEWWLQGQTNGEWAVGDRNGIVMQGW